MRGRHPTEEDIDLHPLLVESVLFQAPAWRGWGMVRNRHRRHRRRRRDEPSLPSTVRSSRRCCVRVRTAPAVRDVPTGSQPLASGIGAAALRCTHGTHGGSGSPLATADHPRTSASQVAPRREAPAIRISSAAGPRAASDAGRARARLPSLTVQTPAALAIYPGKPGRTSPSVTAPAGDMTHDHLRT